MSGLFGEFPTHIEYVGDLVHLEDVGQQLRFVVKTDCSARRLLGPWKRSVLWLSTALTLCACASVADHAPTHKEEKMMVNPDHPQDAPELLRRLLALIDSLHQPQDLAKEQVTRFIQMPLKPIASSRSGGFEIFEQLTHDWLYRFIWHAHDMTPDPDLGLLFYEARGSSLPRPDMAGICQLDAAQFHDALLRMGYRHISSTRRASPARQYQRGLVEVEIGIVGESNDSLEKIGHDCIKRVVVGFFERHPDRGAKR